MHLWGFQGDRWENIHFSTKPRHVTPQIDRLGKMSPVLRVTTPIYAVSKQGDEKKCIFRVNLASSSEWPFLIRSFVCNTKICPVKQRIKAASKLKFFRFTHVNMTIDAPLNIY